MSLLKINHYLKGTPTAYKKTHAGMAFFADSGPAAMTCLKCRFWSDGAPGKEPTPKQKTACCTEYTRLTQGKKGPKVPSSASACKYFEGRKK